MEYKLFDDFITLQALLKTTGILSSGGAIKGFLAENTVLLNGEKEDRRGKKIRIGDSLELPTQGFTITVIAPNDEEIVQYQQDLEEKERIAKLVRNMNKKVKKEATKQKNHPSKKKAVRFPGT